MTSPSRAISSSCAAVHPPNIGTSPRYDASLTRSSTPAAARPLLAESIARGRRWQPGSSGRWPVRRGGSRTARSSCRRRRREVPTVSPRVAKLVSVNVGMPREIAWQGRTVFTGIWKEPVTGPRTVRRLNVDGDGQGDLKGHGGEHRAVYVYQLD